jgi:hypothetical protein
MTVTAAFVGLLPIMVSQGTGADMMARRGADDRRPRDVVSPRLLVYPAVYAIWKGGSSPRSGTRSSAGCLRRARVEGRQDEQRQRRVAHDAADRDGGRGR